MWRPETRISVVAGGLGLLVCLVMSAIGCSATSGESGSVRTQSIKKAANVSQAPDKNTGANETKSIGFVAAALGATAADEARTRCRPGMVSIEGRYCIDRYEASLVEVMPTGEERPFSPFSTIGDQHVRALSQPSVYPQGYISAKQADRACVSSGKRLCRVYEWQQACRGPENKKYGYADQREPGRCNDKGKNPVVALFGFRYTASTMNQPQLNQMEGTLSKTGEHYGCSNGYGVYDMVGNLHEWVADPNGTFYGGYYQDVSSLGHGDGCGYLTTAHEARYHDYSTGFRCCAESIGAESTVTISPPTTPASVRTPRAAPKRHGAKRHK